jgi:transcriptional regulator with XRE-family HTH domain
MAAMTIHRRNGAEIGKVVRLLREKQGLSQLQLAARAGIADNTLRSVERANKTPHRSTLAAISLALGTTVDKLLACGDEAWLDQSMRVPSDDVFLDWDDLP